MPQAKRCARWSRRSSLPVAQARERAEAMRFLEDMPVGDRRETGSFTFTADDIKRFARQFDPQRFHLSEEEGRNSLFGGLAASGWHVAAVCMKMAIADRTLVGQGAGARGEGGAGGGPSP